MPFLRLTRTIIVIMGFLALSGRRSGAVSAAAYPVKLSLARGAGLVPTGCRACAGGLRYRPGTDKLMLVTKQEPAAPLCVRGRGDMPSRESTPPLAVGARAGEGQMLITRSRIAYRGGFGHPHLRKLGGWT